MIHQGPVKPISPIYNSELDSGCESAARASGDGDGGDPSQTEGELLRNQRRFKPKSRCRHQCCHRNPFAASIGLLTSHTVRGVTNAWKHSAASARMDLPT